MNASHALWYLTRGFGVVALLVLTASTLLGVVTATRWRTARWPRFAVADLHRNLTLLALVLIGLHVGTTLLDGYAPVSVWDAFVPFLSRYRPVWLGLGALALDVLLALVVTSLLRKRIGYRVWRALHWSAYAAWPLALAHGLGSGSDARYGWMATLSFACLTLVVGAVAVRLVRDGAPALRLAGGAVVAALVGVLFSWYRTGPARQGWAARAGTPASLLASGSRTTDRLTASRIQARESRSFDGQLVGRMSSSGPDPNGDAATAIAAAVRGSEQGVVRLTLWGTALPSGGLSMSRSEVTFEDVATGIGYSGRIVGLDGNRIVADVSPRSGSSLRLDITLSQIDPTAGKVSGELHAAPASSARDDGVS